MFPDIQFHRSVFLPFFHGLVVLSVKVFFGDSCTCHDLLVCVAVEEPEARLEVLSEIEEGHVWSSW